MKLVMGTAQLGFNYGVLQKKINLKEIKPIKNFLFKCNINIIDTAINYGDSEKIIGSSYLNKLKIITKIKIPILKKKILKTWLLEQIQSSLKKLKINYIYGLLVHDYRDLLGDRGKCYAELLKDLKKKKIIKKIGISIYDPKELDLIQKIFKPDIVQAPFNVFDQRLKNSGWLDKLKKSNVKIYARSCFLQGLLINYSQINRIKNKTFTDHKMYLDSWFHWCRINKISSLKACLAFLKQQKKIDYLVVGFDNFNQLKEIVKNFNQKSISIPDIFNNTNLNLIDPRKWYKL
jgi:aryl-alcohol dehydrogenase-like predicted oxidoreductase